MTFKKMNILLNLAIAQDVNVKTVGEFALFIRRMKV